jgi:thioredoxin 1
MIRNRLLILMVCVVVAAGAAFSQTTKGTLPKKPSNPAKGPVIFVELGSVNCIPCRQMQPVMKAVEKKYGDQIKVVFYDVWKPEQRKYAEQYGIKLIPTQVFIDAAGKEFFRHEGFYPEIEIDKLLQKQGLKVQAGS